MTREEAIRWTAQVQQSEPWQERVIEALDMAIEALKEHKSDGNQIVDDTGYFHCPKCGRKPRDQVAMTDYCPNCGADLRGEDE